MTAAHTPGPWHARAWTCHAATTVLVDAPTKLTAGTVSADHAGKSLVAECETEADARLIAAAPDLLEALRDVIGWVPGRASWHTDAPALAVERARAAIAKATGSAS